MNDSLRKDSFLDTIEDSPRFSSMNASLSNYLRTLRRRLGLSQREMAFLLGTSNTAKISKHENFHRHPSLRTALAYEVLFRTPIREQFDGVRAKVERDVMKRVEKLIGIVEKARPSRQKEAKLRALRTLLESVKEQFT